ncbi:uncharacterized protein LOC130894916 [Diorhabda carinulata]|uniref:uncharacterized protein LOC130894916 n=1 Tax=Diorhabda carinulata TaxID=1163345 RepID=UPI0025A2C7F7|nr:uncharacterized protein LOC130894916 [Diorhabda carinulata]
MAARKQIRDFARDDLLWKAFINSEDGAEKIWRSKWGWQLDEYKSLQETMKEYTTKSQLLRRVFVEAEKDLRKLGKLPESTNHMYGYVAANPEFKLEKYGPEVFVPLHLPKEYKIINTNI